MNEKAEVLKRYGDIIGMKRPISNLHKQMPMVERTAQFSPFAALSGYEEGIEEATRRTDQAPEAYEERENEISRRLAMIDAHLKEHPAVVLRYFERDSKKAGGCYRSYSGRVKKMNPVEMTLETEDGIVFSFASLVGIEGDLFE